MRFFIVCLFVNRCQTHLIRPCVTSHVRDWTGPPVNTVGHETACTPITSTRARHCCTATSISRCRRATITTTTTINDRQMNSNS